MASLLQLENVKKYFSLHRGFLGRGGASVRAVDGVSLSLRRGEHLGLVGESGSGKTTLGRLILRLYRPDGGRVIVDGEDVTALPDARLTALRRKVQVVFQDPYSSLDPRQTVRSILEEGFTLDEGSCARKERDILMAARLGTVGLDPECLSRFPHEFSGGERQRIAIARALVINPRLLILDEAVSSLDVLIQEQIIELLRELQTSYKVTYLFISHNLRVVRKLCAQIAVMYKGKIIERAPTRELFDNPLHPYTRRLLAAAMEYRSASQDMPVSEKENSRLIDRGNGHFVIE